MSTPLEDPAEGPWGAGRPLALALRVLGVLSALVSLVALWSTERSQVPHDLQHVAESRARPGETLALRALLFRDVDEPTGSVLVSAPVRVSLRDSAERELAAAELAQSPLATMDGTLQLPPNALGSYILEARSLYGERELVCRRPLQIAARAPGARANGREAGPMQQFALGRVRLLGSEPAPDPLLVRVVGGACVPEQRCRLLVWVGTPAASVALRAAADHAPAAELVAAPSPPGETSGLVALDVIVRGLDAQVTLQARRQGELVAERTLRLPIGLGEVGVWSQRSLVERAEVELSYAPPPGRDKLIVDVFADGRWRASRALTSGPDGASERLPEAALAFGLVRVQARVDRFSADGSGARALYVRTPGESDAAALAQIAHQLALGEALPNPSSEPTASWAKELPAFALDDAQRTAAFLLAPLEQLRMPVPAPASGRPAQLAKLARTRVSMRFGVAGALVLSALVVALSIARRGLWAADEAEAILVEARAGAGERNEDEAGAGERDGDEACAEGARGDLKDEDRARTRARSLARLRVVLLALAVASAFLAAALLIASKPLWF